MQIDERTFKRLPAHLNGLFAKIPNPSSEEVMEAFAVYVERASGDSGTAARFFYAAKASKKERGAGNTHPTVKPLSLMEWLVKLVTPPGGLTLDMFAGSGTTGKAAANTGRRAVLIEREAAYCEIIRRRVSTQPSLIDAITGSM